ncbi:MAG TPA: U32 family peptidase, partial [Spirochaetia bacterium]|nr:U32 family peptidase [Spirochaetia bacterium]
MAAAMKKQTTRSPKPELLAPAGKAESFFAALVAGADAVYLGVQRFNARLRAANFTLPELSRLIPFAHERKKKVYVTLNTALKQKELPAAAQILHVCRTLRVDGLIVADLGLIALARRHFPDLPLHASTQAGIHNSVGAETMRKLGVRRVILARELSLAEVALIRKHTRCELEVFVHGALCYSLSGNCLASSWIGGKSGNRGLCTQVCRRAFRGPTASAPYFS